MGKEAGSCLDDCVSLGKPREKTPPPHSWARGEAGEGAQGGIPKLECPF